MEKSQPAISVVIGTHNRPEMLPRALDSVLDQTFEDFEIIVVDDGLEIRAEDVVASYDDDRIRYIQHEENKGCSASKNTGARNARADYVAFLDDDDWWEEDKLKIQYERLSETPPEVGFSFTAVANEYLDIGKTKTSTVPDGVKDFHKRALFVFNGFLAGTLIVKKHVFDDIGYLDESFPSHTEIEWLIRVTKKYKGLGINKPLLHMDFSEHEHMGSDLSRRYRGREKLLEKHADEFAKYPEALAKHTFKLSTFYRKDGKYARARNALKRSWQAKFSVRTFLHYLGMFFNGIPYRVLYTFAQMFNFR